MFNQTSILISLWLTKKYPIFRLFEQKPPKNYQKNPKTNKNPMIYQSPPHSSRDWICPLERGLCPRTPVFVGLWASPRLRLRIAVGKY
jgi:hypothetical protein